MGIYIHVPYCVGKCTYCNFYSVSGSGQAEAYVKATAHHLEEYGELCSGYYVDTIYFGGGTPSYLGGKYLIRLLKTIEKNFNIVPSAEITVEANPESMTTDFLKKIYKSQFNRLSMGIQSSDDTQLKKLGRAHTFREAQEAYRRAREAGFTNISVDLMYGLPGQSMESWQKSLKEILALSPDHLSCYALKLEEGTPLYKEMPDLPDDDVQADMYLEACEELRQAGYRHYEISNFAKTDKLSRHNSRYWDLSEYLGVGPGAHSYLGGKRFAFVSNLDAYIQGVMKNGDSIVSAEEEVPGILEYGEYLMLMLRTDFGIDGEEFRRKFKRPFEPYEKILYKYQKMNLAENFMGRWRLTEAGFLVSNTIIGDVVLQGQEI